jgi:hypothetical protein
MATTVATILATTVATTVVTSNVVLVAIDAAQCLLLAQSGHRSDALQCPLLGVKRTSAGTHPMSAFDPKQTSAVYDFCNAN